MSDSSPPHSLSESATHLSSLLEGLNLTEVSKDTGIGYFKLIRFRKNPEAPLQFVIADKLHAYLTGKPLIDAKRKGAA